MKKILVILLLIMYGASSFGMTVHFHYCCGKLKKVDFTPPKDRHCSEGKTQIFGSKPCCDNTKVEIKLSGEQNPATIFHPVFQPEVLAPVYHDYLSTSPFESRKLLPEVFAPPPKSPRPLFVLNCVFRI